MNYTRTFQLLHALTSVQDYTTDLGTRVKASGQDIVIVLSPDKNVTFTVTKEQPTDKLSEVLKEFDTKYQRLDYNDDVLECILIHLLDALPDEIGRIWYDGENSLYAKACDDDSAIVGLFYTQAEDYESEVVIPIIYDCVEDKICVLKDIPVYAMSSLRKCLGEVSWTPTYQMIMAGVRMFRRHIMFPVDPAVEFSKQTDSGQSLVIGGRQYYVQHKTTLGVVKALLSYKSVRNVFQRIELVQNAKVKETDAAELFAVCKIICDKYNPNVLYSLFSDDVVMLTLNGPGGTKRLLYDKTSGTLGLYSCTMSAISILLQAAKNKLEEYESAQKAESSVGQLFSKYLQSNCPDTAGDEVIRILSIQGIANAEDLIMDFLKDVGYVK